MVRTGRPRPQETIRRDDKVVRVLSEAGVPLTKYEIADVLRVPHSLVYLALRRLQQSGRVRYVSYGRKRHAWEPVADQYPLPVINLP